MIERHDTRFITEDTIFGQRAIAQSENSNKNFSKAMAESQKSSANWMASPTGFEIRTNKNDTEEEVSEVIDISKLKNVGRGEGTS